MKKSKTVITVSDLYKIYRVGETKVRALNGVDFAINRGEFCSIVGASGSGKSTLLNMLAGLEKPTKGEIVIAGEHMEKKSENELVRFRQAHIGFIFQSFNLIEEMNIRDNIMLPLTNLKMSRDEKHRRVDEAMRRMGISHRANHYPSQLSGGQQQRAAIARAIVGKPGLILADEPTGNLDSRNGAEVMELLAELHREGATIIMVTHSQKDAACADYIVNLFDGQIVESLSDRM